MCFIFRNPLHNFSLWSNLISYLANLHIKNKRCADSVISPSNKTLTGVIPRRLFRPARASYLEYFAKPSIEGGEVRGSWNSDENFNYVANPTPAVHGGDGSASVTLPSDQKANVDNLAMRTASDPSVNPVTGTDIGAVAPIENEAAAEKAPKKKPIKK